jgi:hypothetical protein
MTISDHLDRFAGKPVKDFEPGTPIDTSRYVYRLTVEYESETGIDALLAQFLAATDPASIDALVIGAWNEPFDASAQQVLDALVAQAAQLSKLRALFVGDMTVEDCEISWIVQGDYEGLLKAYPHLEELVIRGGNDLTLSPFKHDHLKRLTVQTGGLRSEIVRNIAMSILPALEHLELWLGDEGYGFDGDVALFRDVLFAQGKPAALRSLGLRDSEIADELAVWLAATPWVAELDTLDLSMGTLGDEGGEALAASPYVRELVELKLAHHYLSEPVQAKLQALPLAVDLSDAQEADEDGDRYVAVSE